MGKKKKNYLKNGSKILWGTWIEEEYMQSSVNIPFSLSLLLSSYYLNMQKFISVFLGNANTNSNFDYQPPTDFRTHLSLSPSLHTKS